MKEYENLRPKDKNNLKRKLLESQQHRCILCGKEIEDLSKACLDHQHCTKSEILGEDGAGLIRGVLCSNCNAYEGKIWNNYSRFVSSQSNVSERIQFLQKLINYYALNYQHVQPTLHPSEKRVAKLKKSLYNKIKKSCEQEGIKCPQYTGNYTKRIKELMERFGIPDTDEGLR